jgi:hypothetical protein
VGSPLKPFELAPSMFLRLMRFDVTSSSGERLGRPRKGGKAVHQCVEDDPAPRTGPEILVHHDPGPEIKPEFVRKNADELRTSSCQRNRLRCINLERSQRIQSNGSFRLQGRTTG